MVYCLSKDLKCEELSFDECNDSEEYIETYNNEKNCLTAKNSIELCLNSTKNQGNAKTLSDCI